MNAETFDVFLEETLDRARTTLASKATEYADGAESRFHNFEKAAWFLDSSEEQALWGFVTKHLVSLQDMINAKVDPQEPYVAFALEQWDEKIGDVINYMILLRGIVHHRASLACTCPDVESPLDDHVVVVTNDDPEIHILNEPTDDQKDQVRAVALTEKEQLAAYQKEQEKLEGKPTNGIKFPENLPSRGPVTIHNITVNPSVPNHAPIGAEMLSNQRRAQRYPDLSGFTGKK